MPKCLVLLCPVQDEKEFRDKLSSIYVAMNFSLDPNAAADAHGLRPVLNYQAASLIVRKVRKPCHTFFKPPPG